MSTPGPLTIPEAAKLLGITRTALYQAADKGRFEIVYVDRHPHAEPAEVERYRLTILAWLDIQILAARAALIRRNRQLERCERHRAALTTGGTSDD